MGQPPRVNWDSMNGGLLAAQGYFRAWMIKPNLLNLLLLISLLSSLDTLTEIQ